MHESDLDRASDSLARAVDRMFKNINTINAISSK